jgi:uncharacterized RDD family membrane protein YckC
MAVNMDRQARGVSRIVGTFVNPLVSAVDVDAILEHTDLDALIERVDLQRILERIDVNALIEQVDFDRLLERVDLDEILVRIDVNSLVRRLDVDALVERVDVNGIVEEVDVARIVKRIQIGDVMTESAGTAALSALDVIRRQLAGVDSIIYYLSMRLVRRHAPPESDSAGPISGRPAGGCTRLLAYVVDTLVVSAAFSLAVLVCSYLAGLFVGHTINPVRDEGPWWSVGAAGFAIIYYWASVTMTGRTFGKALLGLRVTRSDGSPVGGWSALVRVLVFPLSLIMGLGLLGIVFGRSKRALHDYIARTMVVYDWGKRAARIPTGVVRWLGAQNEPPRVTVGQNR